VRSLTLAIPDTTAAKLAELAREQYRSPRHQAAALLVDAIERASKIEVRDSSAAERSEREA
jgi:hypothetical protein